MQNYKKEKWIYKNFIFNITIICLVYLGLTHTHYATDTYNNIFNENINWQLSVGRYSIFILGSLFEYLGISLIKYQNIFMIVSIVLLAESCTLLNILLSKKNELKFDIRVNIALLIGFINVYIIELFLFPEYSIYYSMGIVFVILAICYNIKGGGLSKLLSFTFLIISLGFYQGNIAIFIIISIFILMIYGIGGIKNIFSVFFVSGIASLLNILLNKLFVIIGLANTTSRDASFDINSIFNNIKIIVKEQKNILWNNSGLLYGGTFFVILLFLLFTLFSIYFFQGKKIKEYIYIIILLLITYFSVYLPHYIAGEIWLSPRTIYPMYFWISFIEIHIIYMCDVKSKINKNLLLYIVLIPLLVEVWAVNGIILNHFSTNKVDQEYAFNIYKEIQNYEINTGIEVTEIATVNDKIPSWKNHFINYYSYNMNERAFINEWSDVSLVNFVSGRNFGKVEMDEEIYRKYFQNKDWDWYCPQEQLYFDNNILYWCKY